MTSRYRLLLADDHAIVTAGLRHILEPTYEIVGEVSDGRALVLAEERLRPDIVIVDISMPLLSGIEATRQIRKHNSEVKIIFLTMHPDITYAFEALRAGGSGYVLKCAAGTEVLDAIRETMNGRIYVTPSINRELLHARIKAAGPRADASDHLTGRQREVLQLLAEGRSLKEIANILHVSIKTAEFHKYRVMKLLGLHTTAEITKVAVKLGITSLET